MKFTEQKLEQFDRLMRDLINDSSVEPIELRTLGDYQLKYHDTTRAVRCYQLAIDRGLDSLMAADLHENFPDLMR